jgi:hypothetical protein
MFSVVYNKIRIKKDETKCIFGFDGRIIHHRTDFLLIPKPKIQRSKEMKDKYNEERERERREQV